MRLPSARLDLPTQTAEFDVWITPTTGEVRDSERFRRELDRVCRVFEVLGTASDQFTEIAHCDPAAIAQSATSAIAGKAGDESTAILDALAGVLYLVTGRGTSPRSMVT